MLGYNTGSSGISGNNGGAGISLNQNAFGNAVIGNISIGDTTQTGGVTGAGGTGTQSMDLKIPQGGAGGAKGAGGAEGAGESGGVMSSLSELAPMAAAAL